jgi:iron(III) transport system ATP-binding protein
MGGLLLSQVELKGVSKRFGSVTGVEQLNLTIREGEFFTLLGPSGCGKTTTLRMIAGFHAPSQGRIRFDGKDVTEVPPQKRGTGMVFQNYALFPHMTVFENVAFGLQVRKIPKSERKERVEQALDLVRLGGYGDRRIAQLSGGQQQRVALARALVVRPRILLLDEPLSNLDARLRDEMRSEILSLQRSLGITTIYVTHDQVEALSMSDRIAVFHQGSCRQTGTPEQIYNQPADAFVASFIGETNLLSATVEEVNPGGLLVRSLGRRFRVEQRREEVGLFSPGEKVWISIRPEGVELVSDSGENTLSAELTLVQFMGFSFHCTAWVEEEVLIRALFVNRPDLTAELRTGEKVVFRLPADRIRLLPGGDRSA